MHYLLLEIIYLFNGTLNTYYGYINVINILSMQKNLIGSLMEINLIVRKTTHQLCA